MGTPSLKRSWPGTIGALLVTGFGIGWLAGLSVSPVVSIVITSVTGSIATIVAALSGVKDEFLDRETSTNTTRNWLRQVTPVPLAWLVGGLIVGSVLGILVRTHNLLSPTLQARTISDEMNEWVALGLTPDEVARRLFEARLPVTNSTNPVLTEANSQPYTSKDSVLFASASQSECESWAKLIDKQNYEELRVQISSSSVVPFRQLPEIITNTVVLGEVIGKVLCVATPIQR